MAWMHFVLAGALWAALGVIMGAFGSHALKLRVDAAMLQVYETAVRYQMYHAFALIIVGLLAIRIELPFLRGAGYFFLAGTLVFSGSLYSLVLSGHRFWGAITPVGGVLLILGWLLLVYSMTRIS